MGDRQGRRGGSGEAALREFEAQQRRALELLSDQALGRFLVYWRVREEAGEAETLVALRTLFGGGPAAVLARAGGSVPGLADADAAAALASGLAASDGRALVGLLAPYFSALHAALRGGDQARAAATREQFARVHGAEAVALLSRWEDRFLPIAAEVRQRTLEWLRRAREGDEG